MSRPSYNDMGAVGAVFGGCIYIFGASTDTEQDQPYKAMAFDPELGQWKDLPSLPRKHLRARTWTTPGFIYVCGGYRTDDPSLNIWYDPLGAVSNHAARFNCKQNQWEDLPPLLTPSSCCHLHELI